MPAAAMNQFKRISVVYEYVIFIGAIMMIVMTKIETTFSNTIDKYILSNNLDYKFNVLAITFG